MTADRARKRAIRARMAATGEPYSVAARHIDAELANGMATGTEVPTEEQGWRGLPTDATPAQRARAEAVWRATTNPDQPCRCSGRGEGRPCHHGERCDNDPDGCPGRLVHADRYPGSMLSLTAWHDDYVCLECNEVGYDEVTLPHIPWGERLKEGQGFSCYPDVRHPNFPSSHPGYDEAPEMPDGDGTCRGCGSYALEGFLCDSCRAEGWTDYKGFISEPGPDDHRGYDEDEDSLYGT